MDENYSKKDYNFIGFTSILISLIGLIASFFTYKIINSQDDFRESNNILQEICWNIKPLYLNIGWGRGAFDVWEVFTLGLLLVGGIIFFLKKGKDTRLIAFVFSMMLLSNIIVIINIVHFFFFVRTQNPGWAAAVSWVSYLFSLVAIVYIIVSYKILRIINHRKVLDIQQTERSTKITDTPKWQRFFHFLIDTVVMGLILNSLLFRIFETHLKHSEFFQSNMNNKFTILLVIMIFRFLYYPFYEIVFGKSPAKFLTESRLVSSKAEKPSASSVFTRTLCRNIPFNPFSFLWYTGWHDSLSQTYVVKEKREGYKTSRLLWILPVLAVYMIVYYYGKDLQYFILY